MNDPEATVHLLLVGLSFNIVVALVGWVVGRRHPAWARSALLAQTLVAAFFLLMVLTPMARADAEEPESLRLLSLALFLGLLGLLKLLGRFEEPG